MLVVPLVDGGESAEEYGYGRRWRGMPPDSRILDNCCWISLEKSSFGFSKRPVREMGRTGPRFPMPFHAMLGSRFSEA